MSDCHAIPLFLALLSNLTAEMLCKCSTRYESEDVGAQASKFAYEGFKLVLI